MSEMSWFLQISANPRKNAGDPWLSPPSAWRGCQVTKSVSKILLLDILGQPRCLQTLIIGDHISNHTVTHSKTLADNYNTHPPGLVLRSHRPQVVPQRWTVQGSPQRARGNARPQLRSRAGSPRAGTCTQGSRPWASSGSGCRLPGSGASSSRRGDPRCARGTRP